MQLYLVSMADAAGDETFLKIGVSADIRKRFAWGQVSIKDSDLPLAEKVKRMMKGETHIADHPYVVTVKHVVNFDLEGFAYEAEAGLLAVLKEADAQYWPQVKFSGQSECFRCNDEITAMIVDYMTDRAVSAPKDADMLRYRMAATRVQEADPLAKHLKALALWKSEKP